MAPSVNGVAEVFNKWIAAYLYTMQAPPNKDWEGRLTSLCLATSTDIESRRR